MSKFQNIKDAAGDRKKVLITYKKKDGSEVRRLVSPYEKKGKFIYATCGTHNNQIHSFVLKSIKKVKVTDENFRPKWEVKL